jgi:hypothetical protein
MGRGKNFSSDGNKYGNGPKHNDGGKDVPTRARQDGPCVEKASGGVRKQ